MDRLTFSDAQVSAFRMHRHHLDLRAPGSRLASVVGDVCGVQAQVTVMARIALWARLRELALDDVERALVQRRTIVKIWSMRGALHLHPSNEFLVVLGGLMPTRLVREQRWIRRVGLNEEETTAMVLKALEKGPLTRRQIAEYLAKRLGAKTTGWTDGGWGRERVGSINTSYLVRPALVRASFASVRATDKRLPLREWINGSTGRDRRRGRGTPRRRSSDDTFDRSVLRTSATSRPGPESIPDKFEPSSNDLGTNLSRWTGLAAADSC